MDRRDEWIRELVRRQDNIDPIRRIPNGALFQGALINGNLRLNKVQRVGAIFVGLCGLATVGSVLVSAIADSRAGDLLQDVWFLIVCPFYVWFSWKIVKNAIVNDPVKARQKKTSAPR
jgi:hypothetical protein